MPSRVDNFTVRLDYPDPVLNPNDKSHWFAKSESAQFAKAASYLLTKDAICKQGQPEPHFYLVLEFCPPDRRKRDLDNAEASMKSAIDGMFRALWHDDSEIVSTFKKWGAKVKGGCVNVTLVRSVDEAVRVMGKE